MESKIELKGEALVEVRKKDGTVIEREIKKNLIVNTGLERMARRLMDDVQSPFVALAIGEGTTAAQATDVGLESEVTRVVADKSYEANNKAVLEYTFSFGSGEVYAVTEAGIFDSAISSGSTMLDRVVFSAKNVDSDVQLYVKITVTIA